MQADQIDFGLMVLFGLASSLHCAGMCGPLCAVASAPLARASAPGARVARGWLRLLSWHGAYHLGRGLGYVGLGAALGMTGVALGKLGAARTLGGVIQIAVGAVFIGLALRLLFRRSGGAVPAGGGRLARLLRRLVTSGRPAGMLGLGLATALLPCGVLYAAFARAAAADAPAAGGRLMLAFFVGTVPLLLAVGLASGGLVRALGRHAAPLLFVVMVTTGGWLAAKGYVSVSATSRPAAAGVCPHAALAPSRPAARLTQAHESLHAGR